jgi:hypothetical protein
LISAAILPQSRLAHELEEFNTQLYSASGLSSVQLDSRLKGMDLLEIIDDAMQYVPAQVCTER